MGCCSQWKPVLKDRQRPDFWSFLLYMKLCLFGVCNGGGTLFSQQRNGTTIERHLSKFSSVANFSKKPSLLSTLNKLLNSSIFHIYFIVAFILYLSSVLLDLTMFLASFLAVSCT